ncbi:MAG: Leucine-rich repeat containing protein, variant 2 [Marteilia pararefringens]
MSAAAAVHLPSEVDDRRSDLREVESEYVAVDLSYSKLRKVPHLGKNSAHDLEKNINVESKRRPKEKSSKSGSLGRSLRQILRRIGNNNGEDDESNRNLRTTDTNKENDEEISRVLANLQSQQIIELNLQNNYLKKIETELSNLINLQKLIIRDCQLTEFPESILKLPILSYVDIGKNLISNLPQCFVDSALKTLILDENKFVMGVPPGLFQNRNIEYLNCSSNTIYQSLSWITMQKDLKIKNIEMHLCSLTNISNLTDLEELKAIDVSANSITSLPHSISNWKKLETLILNTNYIHNICESIGKLQELVYLDLSENNIKELPEEICALTNLHILEINSNHIKRIPDSFNKLKSLKTLNLSNNKIRKLSNSLGGLKLLQVIDLSSNQLDNLCFETIHVLKNLKILNLNNNNITKIPKILNCLENLEELFLQSNSITEIETGLYFDSLIFMNVVGNDLKYIPNSIFESKNLKHFKYHENQDGSNLNSNDMENLKLFVTDEQADVSQLKYPESQTFNSPEIQKNVTILKQKKVSFSMSNGQTKAALLIDSQTTHYYHSNAIIMHMDREISDMLGISIRGGIDSFPINHKDFGIFVASVSPHSDMYSRGIRAFDKIRKIDNKCLSNIKHKKAIEIFKSLPQNFLIEVVPQIGSVLDVFDF